MSIPIDDILIVLGVAIVVGALFANSWQAGLVGVGLALIGGAVWIRGKIVRRQQKRRRK